MPTGCLPTPPARLVGRESEIAELVGAAADKRRLVVQGAAGVGTTAVVAEAARRLSAPAAPRRVVYLSLIPGADRDWTVASLVLLLCGPQALPLPAERRLTVLLKAVSEEPTLLVWDHLDRALEGLPEAPAEALHPLLELGVELTQAAQTRLVLVTERERLAYFPYQPSRRVGHLAVGPLPAEACTALAADLVGRDDRRTAAAVAAARGNPLALRLRLAVGTPADGGGVDPAADPVDAALDTYLAAAGPGTAAALEAAALLLGGGPEPCWREVIGLDGTSFEALANTAAAAGLIAAEDRAAGRRRLSLHDAARRRLARRLADRPEALRQEIEERHRRAFLALADRLAGAADPDPAQPLEEQANLVAAFACSLGEDRDRTAALADALQDLLGGPCARPPLIDRVLAHAAAIGRPALGSPAAVA